MRIKSVVQGLLVLSVMVSLPALAGNDPSIKGDLRSNIQQSMTKFIETNTVDGKIFLYDAAKGGLLKLTFDNLHSGIVKKGDFYVSCADFIDQNNRKVDIDFLVVPNGGGLVASQALIHAIDGNKRKYHLENI